MEIAKYKTHTLIRDMEIAGPKENNVYYTIGNYKNQGKRNSKSANRQNSGIN